MSLRLYQIHYLNSFITKLETNILISYPRFKIKKVDDGFDEIFYQKHRPPFYF